MIIVGGRSATGWGLAFAIAGAAPVFAQDAGAPAGTTVLPNIHWSLSGETSVRAPAQHREAAPATAPQVQAHQATARKPAAKKAAPTKPAPARLAGKAGPAQPLVKARPAIKPAAAQVAATVTKPVTVKAPIRPAVAPAPVAVQPPTVTAQPPPAMPPPAVVEDSDAGLVTTHPLTPRKAGEDDGSFNHAVAAAASYTRGIPPLRPTVGVLSLAAALFALIALWWQSVGARRWGAYRRKAQPRLMIDIPLASEDGADEPATPGIAFDGNAGWDGPGSSRLGDQAAAE